MVGQRDRRAHVEHHLRVGGHEGLGQAAVAGLVVGHEGDATGPRRGRRSEGPLARDVREVDRKRPRDDHRAPPHRQRSRLGDRQRAARLGHRGHVAKARPRGVDVGRHEDEAVAGHRRQAGHQADLPQQVGGGRPFVEAGPEACGDLTRRHERGGHEVHGPAGIDRGHPGREPRVEAGEFAGAPGEPLLPQRPLDEPRPLGEPLRSGGRVAATERLAEPAERDVVEAPGHARQVQPAVVRKQQREARDGRSAGESLGRLGDHLLHRRLHPRIEDVVVKSAGDAARPAVRTEAGDAGRGVTDELRLERGDRGVEGEGGHDLQALAAVDGGDRAEHVLGQRVESRIAGRGGIPASRLSGELRRPDGGAVGVDRDHPAGEAAGRERFGRVADARQVRRPVGERPAARDGDPARPAVEPVQVGRVEDREAGAAPG